MLLTKEDFLFKIRQKIASTAKNRIGDEILQNTPWNVSESTYACGANSALKITDPLLGEAYEIIVSFLSLSKMQQKLNNTVKPRKLNEALTWRENDDFLEEEIVKIVNKATNYLQGASA